MSGSKSAALVLLASLLLRPGTAPAAPGDPSVDPAGGRSVGSWEAGPDSPAARIEGGVARFSCPFDGGADRHYWDAALETAPPEHGGWWVDYEVLPPSAFRAVTLYVGDGTHWSAAYVPLVAGRHSVYLSRGDFQATDGDVDWRAVDRVRLSPWKGEGGGGDVLLYGLRGDVARLLLVDPGAASVPREEERAYAKGLADWMAGVFARMSLPVARIPDTGLASADLSPFEIAVLPYNPLPSKEMLSALERFVAAGGTLMVFYAGSDELAALAEMKLMPYRSAPSPEAWAAMRFEEEWGGPGRVHQPGTDNLIPARPADGGEVLAWWEDARGGRSREPAVAATDRAVWVSSVLTPVDEPGKRRMLAFLADRLKPDAGFAARAARVRVDEARGRAGMSWEEFLSSVEDAEELRTLSARAERLSEERPGEGWDLAERLADEIDRRVAARTELPPFEMLGVWDHGAGEQVAGGWEGTLDLLAGAGITDLFVFTGRGRGFPPRLTERAAARGLRVHAWHMCWNLDGVSPTQVRRYRREERLQIAPDGTAVSWLCPSNETNREMERRRLEALAETGGLAGLHLDYIRWPDGPGCVCGHCGAAFEESLGREPDWPAAATGGADHEAWRVWRAELISSFVREVSEAVRGRRPDLTLSAAVWPGYPETVARLGQDWPVWVRSGWLDFVAPMSYTVQTGQFRDWTASHVRLAGDSRRVVPGIGFRSAESSLTPAQMLRQARAAADAGVRGVVIFDLNPTFRREAAPALRLARRPEGAAP